MRQRIDELQITDCVTEGTLTVAATRKNAAIFEKASLRRSAEAPLRLRRITRWLAEASACIGLLLLNSSLVYADRTQFERELIRDPHFQNGFILLETKPGKRVPYGEAVAVGVTAKPAWDIGQWSSKFPLEAGRQDRLPNGFLVFTNAGKCVRLGAPGTAEADLSLGVNASVEYGGHARKAQIDPWVHLLVQQDIENPPSVAELAACRFHIEALLKSSKLHRTDDYTPARHAAQFQVFLTVANRNPKSPGFGQYLWFGVPLYDDRSRIVPAHAAQDFGDTKMFIYTPSSSEFSTNSTHDGGWVIFARDLLPLMREGLATGWQRGFMPGSRDLADYHVTGIFIGWEVPGLFDVEMQIRKLSLVAVAADAAEKTAAEYLSDHLELVLNSTQDWGELGLDVAAHASGITGAPLQIGSEPFTKGLGHHVNGAITVLLDGQYESFDAQVGLQPCNSGSVVFRVLVDGQPRFDSGVMRSGDAPKPVHVSVAGAQELRLEATDAGDGIACDMANWAEARLTPATNASKPRPVANVDMARFARVLTWDPRRMDGARANRIEEFRAEDLFTETELAPNRSGDYTVPVWTNGLGCIGLQWLNRRALRELALEFENAAQIPASNTVRVEGWFGESAWQGNWKPLAGELRREPSRLVLQLAPKAGVVQTQKIRWVLPVGSKQVKVRPLAFTRSGWATTNIVVEIERPKTGARAEVAILNGEVLGDSGTQNPQSEVSWNMTRPLRLGVRYSRPSAFKSDPTVLQFHLPTGNVGVAVEDVLANDCVYLPDHGLFVAREPQPVTLAEYKRRIAGRKTILDEVRALPDQTLGQAMAKTHHEAQREGPVLLSLACDNTKFIVERDGAVQCVVTTNAAVANHEARLVIRPHFGDGKSAVSSRTLDGGWLPIPIITRELGGVECRQRTFVAPCDEPGSDPARFNRRSVCVMEFTITNTQAKPAETSFTVSFAEPRAGSAPLKLEPTSRGWTVAGRQESLAFVTTTAAAPLGAVVQGNTFKLSGALPAQGVAKLVVFVPATAGSLETVSDALDVSRLQATTEAYWNAVLAPATQISTPDPLLNDVIRSSQVRCLIDARSEADGARVAAWIAAMSYGPLESESHSVIRGLDFLGHDDFARRSLEFFVHRYNTNGFLTTGYTTFGTAWHLWTLGEHYQLTYDKAWLRQIAPEIVRVGHWIVRQTEKTRKLDAHGRPMPESGLMPPGVLADWNSFAYHFAMNAYYAAALRELGNALGEIRHREASFFKKHAAELKANTLRAYAWTQSLAPALALRDGTWIPHYPSQVHSPGKLGDFFPGQDAGRSWCYDVELGAHQLVPARVLDPRSREVERMMDHMEDVQFLSDGWFDYPAATNHADRFNLGGFSKVQPYYTRNCEVYALRDDVKPFIRSYFNSIASLLNPEGLTFWEHFRHSGAWDKTHETGYFLHQTRTMLVQERGEDLWLAPFVTDQWLKDGERIAVKNAPTRFGKVSYEITSRLGQGFIEAQVEPPTRERPRQTVLRLRHPDGKPIQSVTVNGKAHSVFDRDKGLVRLGSRQGPAVIRLQY